MKNILYNSLFHFLFFLYSSRRDMIGVRSVVDGAIEMSNQEDEFVRALSGAAGVRSDVVGGGRGETSEKLKGGRS